LLILTCLGLHNIETSKQRINVERIIESFDGSPKRCNDDDDVDDISSFAKFAKSIGTLRRINCSHFIFKIRNEKEISLKIHLLHDVLVLNN
jgi:hypothetical protein